MMLSRRLCIRLRAVLAFIKSGLLVALAGLALFTQVGCATVEPWDRGKLAKPKMALDPDPLASQLETHVYNYREGATGGFGSVGGGCGCN